MALTIELIVSESVSYDPETGELTWRKDRPKSHFSNRSRFLHYMARWAGRKLNKRQERFTISHPGIHTKIIMSHVCWLLHHGSLPSGVIDHKNGDHFDNRITNLRDVTRQQNAWNTKTHKDNKSGYKGVFWAKHAKRYAAQICLNGKRKHLGYFHSAKEAHEVYCSAAQESFSEFCSFR